MTPDTPPDRPDSPASAAGLPARIGRYRVRARLGEGATSEVYLAHDDFHGRDVAIKRMRAPGAGGAADELDVHYASRFFAAEAALVGRLDHPNVVRLIDAVADPPAPYLVMEYVPGDTLRRFCHPQRLLPLQQVVEVGFKCASALGHCWRQGLIHRDIKPANLLCTLGPQGELGEVKVSDFGSVLSLGSDRTQVLRVGSLYYMAPEQFEGIELDARADIYALSAVLYHLVAGRPPFEAASQPALMQLIARGAAPSLVDAREGVSPALDALVRAGMARRREDRPAGWEAFAAALAALARSDAVPRATLQAVLDSERFSLMRPLEFFADFGDAQLWEVARRARWQRYAFGERVYRKAEVGGTFHIIAQGCLDVHREGRHVARLRAGTCVGEMAYLAPNPDLRRHGADVTACEPTTTIAFDAQSLQALSLPTRSLFDAAFIRVLVRRLHAASESLAEARRLLPRTGGPLRDRPGAATSAGDRAEPADRIERIERIARTERTERTERTAVRPPRREWADSRFS